MPTNVLPLNRKGLISLLRGKSSVLYARDVCDKDINNNPQARPFIKSTTITKLAVLLFVFSKIADAPVCLKFIFCLLNTNLVSK